MSDYKNEPQTDGIYLAEVVEVILERSRTLLAIVLVGVILSAGYALSLPNMFSAKATLATTASSSGGLNNLASQYEGIARLAGINMSRGSASNPINNALNILKSRTFALSFFEAHEYLALFAATKSWDSSDNSLHFDITLYDPTKGQWLIDPETGKTFRPTDEEAHRIFLSAIAISYNEETGLIILRLTHQSPHFAAEALNNMVTFLNQSLRENDLDEANAALEFLASKVTQTPVADMRQILFQLKASQMEKIMLAGSSVDYVLKFIDPAIPPEHRSSPNRKVICVVGGLAALILGLMFIFFQHFARLKN